MNFRNWRNKLLNCSFPKFKKPFHIITLTLLSLLLPLSFLIIARLSCYNFLLTITSQNPTQLTLPSSIPFTFFLYINPIILYSLLSIFSLATLIDGLSTGKINISSLSQSKTSIYNKSNLYLYFAWIWLCITQTCVGLGIQGSLDIGLDGFNFGIKRSLFSRMVLFVGLHECMIYWSSTIVKPIIDDTIYGVVREEDWVHRVAKAMSFGTLWWWRLRDEVESLVIVVEAKGEMMADVGVVDLVGCWLYYLTLTIGIMRFVKGLLWVGMVLVFKRVRRNNVSVEFCEEENKV